MTKVNRAALSQAGGQPESELLAADVFLLGSGKAAK